MLGIFTLKSFGYCVGDCLANSCRMGISSALACAAVTPGRSLKLGETNVRVLRDLERKIHVRRAPFETRRHHANDLVGLVHQLDGPADDVGVAEIVSLPKLVGQHDYGLRGLSRRRIGGNQPAPLLRADAPMIWSVRRNIHRL